MNIRVDPGFVSELKQYGAVGISKCFNCGNCTAICPLTDDEHAFPRDIIRLAQLGQRERIERSLDPWLCYYCGDCSDTCPKGAEPAETMMASRRWLTAQYDWTGLARRFYTSQSWEIGSMIVVGLLVVLAFVLFHGPLETNQVSLNTFAPVSTIHLADWIMAGGLLFFVGTNVLRMYHSILGKEERRIPLRLYLSEAWSIVYQFVTQVRWSQCAEDEEDENMRGKKRFAWVSHLLLVSGYVIMLILVVLFLPWFQTDNIYPFYHPQRWLGYYATAVLLFGAGKALWGRMKKDLQLHRFSHASDWIFPILLLVVTLTGIVQHTLRYLGYPLATYYTYVVHLAFAAPMLILEVPFGKWSHLYYRPLAIYFDRIKIKAAQVQESMQTAAAAAA
ncbi:MAG: 4Fe-4S dicluster domain-containing protein [Anaerolineales bacterium]